MASSSKIDQPRTLLRIAREDMEPTRIQRLRDLFDLAASLDSDERSVFLEKEALPSLEALRSRLTEIHGGEPERRVVIKGDASLAYAKMRDAFAMCQDVGFAGVSLLVSQKGGKKAADAPDEG